MAPTNDKNNPEVKAYFGKHTPEKLLSLKIAQKLAGKRSISLQKESAHEIGFPTVIRISSDKEKESIYSLRTQLRKNVFKHDEFTT